MRVVHPLVRKVLREVGFTEVTPTQMRRPLGMTKRTARSLLNSAIAALAVTVSTFRLSPGRTVEAQHRRVIFPDLDEEAVERALDGVCVTLRRHQVSAVLGDLLTELGVDRPVWGVSPEGWAQGSKERQGSFFGPVRLEELDTLREHPNPKVRTLAVEIRELHVQEP